MKAFLINTEKRKVEEIEIGDYKDIYKHIGNGCDTFACPVSFENGDTLYCDDEGLFHEFQGGIMMKDWQYPIVGNIVVQGTNRQGNSVEPKTSKEELEAMIKWIDKANCQKWADKFN